MEYRRGEALFTQGDRCEHVQYIQKGNVKLSVFSKSGRELSWRCWVVPTKNLVRPSWLRMRCATVNEEAVSTSRMLIALAVIAHAWNAESRSRTRYSDASFKVEREWKWLGGFSLESQANDPLRFEAAEYRAIETRITRLPGRT